jgi:hypothetical protein
MGWVHWSVWAVAAVDEILAWCAAVLGPFEVVSDDTREHPGERATAYRLRTPAGSCYVKAHRDRSHWESEVHAYEHWAPAFGEYAPKLLAVRAEAPRALIISELAGKKLEGVELPAAQEQAIWRAAGSALAGLHGWAVGDYFGPCRRDGSPAEKAYSDAQEFIAAYFDDWGRRGRHGGYLSEAEWAVVEEARALIPAFAGERPLPCHRFGRGILRRVWALFHPGGGGAALGRARAVRAVSGGLGDGEPILWLRGGGARGISNTGYEKVTTALGAELEAHPATRRIVAAQARAHRRACRGPAHQSRPARRAPDDLRARPRRRRARRPRPLARPRLARRRGRGAAMNTRLAIDVLHLRSRGGAVRVRTGRPPCLSGFVHRDVV